MLIVFKKLYWKPGYKWLNFGTSLMRYSQTLPVLPQILFAESNLILYSLERRQMRIMFPSGTLSV